MSEKKTAYDKYSDIFSLHAKKCNSENEFFEILMKEFQVGYDTAMDMWYAPQRSWFKEEMMEEIIRLDNSAEEGFRPNLCSGEFKWDSKTKRFMPDK